MQMKNTCFSLILNLTWLSCVLCQFNICKNGGTQILKEGLMCECVPGYEGTFCGKKACVHGNRGYQSMGSCSCHSGWEGELCELEAICDHGKRLNETHCTCNDGYKGQVCDQIICKNGKPGTRIYDSDTCICDPKWEGTFCDEFNCNRGVVLSGGRSGRCFKGWSGDQCDKEKPSYTKTIIIICICVGIVVVAITVFYCKRHCTAQTQQSSSGVLAYNTNAPAVVPQIGTHAYPPATNYTPVSTANCPVCAS